MNKMEIKVHNGYPILFLILHMCLNFHQNRKINKDFFLLDIDGGRGWFRSWLVRLGGTERHVIQEPLN